MFNFTKSKKKKKKRFEINSYNDSISNYVSIFLVLIWWCHHWFLTLWSSPANSHQTHKPPACTHMPLPLPSLHHCPSISPPPCQPASKFFLRLLWISPSDIYANNKVGLAPGNWFLFSFFLVFSPGTLCFINKHSSPQHLRLLLSALLCLLLTHIYILPTSIINQRIGRGGKGGRYGGGGGYNLTLSSTV